MHKNLSQNMQFPDIANFQTNDRYFEEISPNIWLMDDHKWAYYIWEKIFSKNTHETPVALFHLDYHWDGVNDFKESTHIMELVNIKEIQEIYNLVLEDYIRKDSFIAPAIIRRLVDEVHFYCKQKDTEPGLDESLLVEYGASQFLHHDIDSLISYSTQKAFIFDIDLDLFNKSGMWSEGDLWDEREIINFVSKCSNIIQSASFITVSMSFGYSGSGEDTRYLTKLFTTLLKTLFDRNKNGHN